MRFRQFRQLIVLAMILALISANNAIPWAIAQPDSQAAASWTFMVYLAADNDLETAGLIDFEEMEWIGSTSDVNIVVQIDRSETAYESTVEGEGWEDWSDTRRYLVMQDQNVPYFGNQPVQSLGEVNMGSEDALADFLTWSVTNYPAQHYALVLWDHGSGWPGIAYDETSGGDGLSVAEITRALDRMRAETGVQTLDVIAFDACLMGQIEVFNAIAPYGIVGVGSPEIVPGSGYDYETILRELTGNPNMDAAGLGRIIVDSFMYYYQNHDTSNPAFSMSVIDLSQVDTVAAALGELATAVQTNPGAVLSHIGSARVNALTYTEYYLDVDQVEEVASVDLGDLMRNLARETNVDTVARAAQNVADTVDQLVIHKGESETLSGSSGVAIYFPRTPDMFEYKSASYLEGSGGDERWTGFLRAFYGSAAELIVEPPQLFITDLFSANVNIYEPTSISMDITGRDIATVSFVINLQGENNYYTLDIDNIVTWQEIDGEMVPVHDWEDGLNQLNFPWDGETPYVSDGQVEAFALLIPSGDKGDVAVADGRFARAGTEDWVEATLVFDLGTREVTTVYGLSNVEGAPPFEIKALPGDKFQLYWSVLSTDGSRSIELGEILTFSKQPIFFDYAPAPDGMYQMGFIVQDIVGNTAYQWTDLQVTNADLDYTLRGYTDFDWGFNFLYPETWYKPSWNSEDQVLYGGPPEDILFTIYPLEGVASVDGALEVMLAKWDFVSVTNQYTVSAGPNAISAIVVEYEYEGSKGPRQGTYAVFYQPDVGLGFGFDLDTVPEYRAEAGAALEGMLNSLKLFNPATSVLASGWTTEVNQTLAFSVPVLQTWVPPSVSNEWLMYMPEGGDGNTFVSVRADANTGETKEQVADGWAAAIADFDGYLDVQITGQREYYIGSETWAAVDFTYVWSDDNTPITGAFFVTTHEDWDYVYWLEAPTSEYAQTFNQTFQTMIDGFAFLTGAAPAAGAIPVAGGPLSEIYTAAGDGYRPDELVPTTTFAADDDLNVIFSTATEVEVQLIFVLPDGQRWDLAGTSFAAGVTDLDGLDWESYGNPWMAGLWSVEIYANGELAQTLTFTVSEGAEAGTSDAGTGAYQAYTASGDGISAHELTPTTVFTNDDDINLVIEARQAVDVTVLFVFPDGRTSEQSASISAGASQVLGLDWESAGVPWVEGEGRVEVYVGGQLVQTLPYTIGGGGGGGAALSDAYMAAGDGVYANELTPTTVFATDDDINIVLVAGQAVDVTALFVFPDGRTSEQNASISAGASQVLGLDWESIGELWLEGEGRVEVYVDGQLVQTLPYTIGGGSGGGGAALSDAYMADGDGSQPDELTPTTVFATDDDINIVVTATEAAEVTALFTLPDGRTSEQSASMAAGEWWVAGLDWEYASVPWVEGEGQVDVYVDGIWMQTFPYTIGGGGSSGGSALSDAYMAAGDGSQPNELTPTTVFTTDDDINIVLVAGQAVDVTALFVFPDGRTSEQSASISAGAGHVLGLDWESIGELWLEGEGRVEVYVDGQLVQTLPYTISGGGGSTGGTAILDSMYTAAGDGSQPDELTPTTVFATDDDINIVVTSTEAVEVTVLFTFPDGRTSEQSTSMAANEWWVAGLDWEYASVPWVTGEGQVDVYVDGVWVQTLVFTIE